MRMDKKIYLSGSIIGLSNLLDVRRNHRLNFRLLVLVTNRVSLVDSDWVPKRTCPMENWMCGYGTQRYWFGLWQCKQCRRGHGCGWDYPGKIWECEKQVRENHFKDPPKQLKKGLEKWKKGVGWKLKQKTFKRGSRQLSHASEESSNRDEKCSMDLSRKFFFPIYSFPCLCIIKQITACDKHKNSSVESTIPSIFSPLNHWPCYSAATELKFASNIFLFYPQVTF